MVHPQPVFYPPKAFLSPEPHLKQQCGDKDGRKHQKQHFRQSRKATDKCVRETLIFSAGFRFHQFFFPHAG